MQKYQPIYKEEGISTNDDSHVSLAIFNREFLATFEIILLFISFMQYIDIHTHRVTNSDTFIEVRNILLNKNETPDGGLNSIGWHPWDANTKSLSFIQDSLLKYSNNKNVIAIGECGLDKTLPISITTQTEVFKLHIDVAKEHSKPLILHCVRAYDEILYVIRKEEFHGKLVFHSFRGNLQQMEQIMKTNAYFSFGKSLMNLSSKHDVVFRAIPRELLLLETDTGEIPIEKIYLRAANLLEINTEELASVLVTNYHRLIS